MINWIGVWIYVGGALVCSFIGMSLPQNIAMLNNNNMTYGIFSSYLCSILLWFIFTNGVSLTKTDQDTTIMQKTTKQLRGRKAISCIKE